MIKAQVLTNFVMKLVRKELELICNGGSKEGSPSWILYSNGLTNRFGEVARVIMEGPEGIMVEHSLCFNF